LVIAGCRELIYRYSQPSTDLRNEDAISATKAALAEGIVPGGGLALLRLIDAIDAEQVKCSGDERTGLLILRRALGAPTRQICNARRTRGMPSVASILLLAKATLTELPEDKKKAALGHESLD
jgi:chaperonin GroEL (HSP60 family)